MKAGSSIYIQAAFLCKFAVPAFFQNFLTPLFSRLIVFLNIFKLQISDFNRKPFYIGLSDMNFFIHDLTSDLIFQDLPFFLSPEQAFLYIFQLIPLSLNLVCRCLTYKSFVRKHPLCSLDLLIQSVFLFFSLSSSCSNQPDLPAEDIQLHPVRQPILHCPQLPLSSVR